MKEYDKPENEIELKSPALQEILGRPPRWIIRWGITVVVVIICGIIVGSYFFKYPDILPASITVTSQNLPADIVAKTSGKLDSIFVKDNQIVKKGDMLAVIENPANISDVMLLRKSLEDFRLEDTSFYPPTDKTLQLGDIQQSYFPFLRAYEDYRFFVETQHYQKQIQITKKQIATQQRILSKTQAQLRIASKQLQSAKQLFAVDSSLYGKNVIPLTSFEEAKSAYFQQEQLYESAKLSLDNQQMGILQLEQSVLNLEQQEREQLNNLLLALSGAYDQLQTHIEQWKQLYMLESAINGIVTMTNYWQQNQNINAGEILLTVVPEEETQIIGKILLPLQGAGKVKKGQMVNVKFDNYPHMEYGMVRVEITNIS